MSRQGGCMIPYGGEEHNVNVKYEILWDPLYSQFLAIAYHKAAGAGDFRLAAL
jgi:hypothetical protein